MTCPLCRGSGRVAYGPWGSRPPTKTCDLCNGTREVADDYEGEYA